MISDAVAANGSLIVEEEPAPAVQEPSPVEGEPSVVQEVPAP
ncbi:MAG: hypothetical protein Q4E01_05350 [Actinomycetaceae bacterium]|nr:hypothetical protein [Actinomycetaceae bacterium]